MISRESFPWEFFLVETKTLWRNISKKWHSYKIVLCPYNFQVDYIYKFWISCKKDFFIIISKFSKFVFYLKRLRVEQHWTQRNSGQFKNYVTWNIQIHALQPWTIVSKCCMSHLTGFMDLLLIKDSAGNLKHCWRTNSTTYVKRRILKKCKRPLRYLIHSCLSLDARLLLILFKHTVPLNISYHQFRILIG